MFTGWVYATGFDSDGNPTGYTDVHDPGEVMNSSEIEAATYDGSVHVYATWGYLANYSISINNGGGNSFVGGTEYTNIVCLTGVGSLYEVLSSYTIRCDDPSLSTRSLNFTSNSVTLNGNLIIDSINITPVPNEGNNHGDESGYGLFANGYKLILGAGVKTETTSNRTIDGMDDYLQVFGGSSGSGSIDQSRTFTPYGSDSELEFSTYVIIHSGVYQNVVAGSCVSSSGSIGSTYLVMKDIAVLDTVIGSCGGGGSGPMGFEVTSSHVYATALYMPGDTYEENVISSANSTTSTLAELGVELTESTILTGGGNNNYTVSSNVYISGTSEVWDIQGGGRRAYSQTDSTFVEVSGQATVKHMVCGAVTDGNNNIKDLSEESLVKSSNVTVTNAAMVAAVYGAGYDTWYNSNYPTMWGTGTTISVNIEGGTVGYVYGGGYRGDVGAEGYEIDSISITMTGGSILGDIYGGGRGGVDKVTHNADGTMLGGSAYTNSTGNSRVYADSVSIVVSDGWVYGHVYGGGESVAALSEYSGITGLTYGSNVAYMECDDLYIMLTGKAQLAQDVLGAGKGVGSEDLAGSSEESSVAPSMYAIYLDAADNEVKLISVPWMTWEDNSGNVVASEYSYVTDSSTYEQYAKTVVNGTLTIYMEGYESATSSWGDNGRGSIYGGGRTAQLEVGELDITLKSAEVADCLFGGGEGSTADGFKDWAGYVKADNITITIADGSEIGVNGYQYAVFGGGAYGRTEVSGEVKIYLDDYDTVIHGDVHGGGFGGDTESEATTGSTTVIMDGDRTIYLNGATVNGSIYGGSRLGADGESGDSYTSTIYLLAGVVMQVTYGGGFQGVSYMDSHIYVGSPAISASGEDVPLKDNESPDLRVNSIYGGGNLSSGTPYAEGSELLMGDATIEIGVEDDYYRMPSPDEESDVPKISIYGDIYGQGNFSLIGGTSTVEIRGYEQYADYTISSIQRTDYLTIGESHISLTGSSDGGDTSISERYALNRIGTLTLDGGAVLELYAESGRITNYYSMVGSSLATQSDCVRSTSGLTGNEIVLHSGRMFSVLGDYNNGTDSETAPSTASADAARGMIYGYTLLSRDEGDTYYGAFACGSIYTDDSTSGFMVDDGAEEAATVNVGVWTQMWYQSGHVGISKALTLREADDWVDGVEVQIPRLTSGSTIAYIGAGINPTVQDGLYFTTSSDFNSFTDKDTHTDFDPQTDIDVSMYVGMTIGGSTSTSSGYIDIGGSSTTTYSAYTVSTHSYDADSTSWSRVFLQNYVNSTNTGGYILPISATLISSAYYGAQTGTSTEEYLYVLGTEGDLGTITLHLVEILSYQISDTENGYVPINMVDVEVSIYAGPKSHSTMDHEDLQTTIVTRRTMTGTKAYTGTAYIALPNVGTLMKYYIYGSADGSTYEELTDDAELLFYSDTTSLNNNGSWAEMTYTSSYTLSYETFYKTAPSGMLYLGAGGQKATALAMVYSGDASMQDGIQIYVWATPYDGSSSSDEGTLYHIIINFQENVPVNLYLQYVAVTEAETKVYMAVYVMQTSAGESASVYALAWVTEEVWSNLTTFSPDKDAETISDGWYSALPVDYGAVLSEDTLLYAIIDYSENPTVSESDAVEGTILEALDALVEDIDDVTVDGQTFSYADNLQGYYLDNLSLSLYDTTSECKDSYQLFACFGIKVTFTGSGGVSLNPQVVYVAPGTVLQDYYLDLTEKDTGDGRIAIWDGESPPGYHLTSDTWTGSNGRSFSDAVYSEVTFSMSLSPNEYTMTLEIDGGIDDSNVTLTVDGSSVEFTATTIGDVMTITYTVAYRQAVSVSVSGDWRVTDASGTYSTDGTTTSGNLTVSVTDYTTASFTVPYAGANKVGTLSVEMTVEEANTVTVVFVGKNSTYYSDALDSGQTLTLSYGEWTAEYSGSSSQTGSFIMSDGTLELSASLDSSSYTWYWAVWVDTGSGDALQTTGIYGRATVGSTLPSVTVGSDVTITVALYRAVDLDLPTDGSISSVTATPVAVPGYSGDVADVTYTSGATAVLFNGYELVVTPSAGYVYPTGYSPSGVSQTGSSAGTYTVLGTAHVVFGSLTQSTMSVTVSISFMDGTTALTKSQLSKVLDEETGLISALTVSYGQSSTTVQTSVSYAWSSDGYTYEASFTAAYGSPGFVYTAVAALDGFSGGTGTVTMQTGATSMSFDVTLTLTRYTLQYYDASGNALETAEGDTTSWSVLDGTKYAYVAGAQTPMSGDYQVWIAGRSSSATSLITVLKETALTLDVFDLADSSNVLYLHAVAVLEDEEPEDDTIYVVGTASGFAAGISVSGTGVPDGTYTAEGVTVTVSGGTLTMDAAVTGGIVIVASGELTLCLIVVADLVPVDQGVIVA
ncbi:MAG: hypothetical protein Q4Q62_04015 [Thermoplasmata archaeon]|nr:hypothetical protein [Thermoplasmata archaeon]